MPHRHRYARKRPTLFALMLAAFVTVIVLGFCGTGTVIVLSTRITQDGSSQNFRPPWMTSEPAAPSPAEISSDGTIIVAPSTPVRNSFDWRVPVSALLAFCAVLIGAATFFSRRVTRPLTRLTRAAQTMAEGKLSVRVEGSSMREIDELAGAFNRMATSLEDADRQRRQMTADVAHELRTPLSIIRGRLEGLQDGIYHPTPDQISTLLNETALLERLIEDLRLLALADTGQLSLYRENIAPASLLQNVARSFVQQASSQGVTLRVAELPTLPDVDADPQRISQVLGNLISNALRHTPAGGTIALKGWLGTQEASNNKQAVFMSVSDTGSGIAPEDLPHVFDRFYRADASRTRASGGAGLGLTIAKQVIDAHHGAIWAESNPGHGTTITFSLPIAKSS